MKKLIHKLTALNLFIIFSLGAIVQNNLPPAFMRKAIALLLPVFLVSTFSSAQKIFYKINLGNITGLGISGIKQDQLGYIWLTAEDKGLLKYDGSKFTAYTHNDKDTNSVSGAKLETLSIDSSGIIWIGTLGGGMDEFDPAGNVFKHFRHHANDAASLSNDSVHAILRDHLGNLWIGTASGLDRYDSKTGRFVHYMHDAHNPNSLSGTHVRVLYEDSKGTLWIGCGSPFPAEESWKDEGGLNRFDRATGNFIRFVHNPNDPASIASNKVRALLEDSKGNFWVGTGGDGLQTLNRKSDKFTHYYYDPTHPDQLSRGPFSNTNSYEQVEFIKEDTKGKLWIGTYGQGIIEYDPSTKKITHYGFLYNGQKLISADTVAGFTDSHAWCSIVTNDGLVWVGTIDGSLFKIDFNKNSVLPYTKNKTSNPVHDGANTFYKQPDGIVWIGTDSGLIRKDEKTGTEKLYLHQPDNLNSISNNGIADIIPDGEGNLWIASYALTTFSLDKFDIQKEKFTHYNSDASGKIKLDSVAYMLQDNSNNLWIGNYGKGIIKMNESTAKCVQYKHKSNDSNSLANNYVDYIARDKKSTWVGTQNGLDRLDEGAGKFYHYLKTPISSVLVDSRGIVWAGTFAHGLFRYDSARNDFIPFTDLSFQITDVISLNEDKNANIWVSSTNGIFEIMPDREHVKIYNSDDGFHSNLYNINYDYISGDGELFIGDQFGYYHFYPDSLHQEMYAPRLNFASLQIGGEVIKPGKNSILNKPLYAATEIKIPDNKNSFSITFSAVDYHTDGDKKIFYTLDNYDNQWHETNSDNTAYLYNLSAGHYLLRVKAINAHGAWSEKTLSIIITPPWWQTWWAITIFVFALVGIILGFSYYRSVQLRKKNRLLEEKVRYRTTQLQQSLEDLKSTQTQLIQQEKMASLGELTAGIAHEIQNPLNFVNNFSEVNRELIEEVKSQKSKLKSEELDDLLNDIAANEEKISYHGKRADAIVKNMLQHSRQTKGVKEPTDINALCDEYLRLSYHGLRAKDKSFNSDFKTNFDKTIDKINIVSQDIGRVLLNLFNNAFYAVNEKKKLLANSYQPIAEVKTRRINDKVEITVSDNGNGISQNIIDKIFQPFFTTKPTGEGTGLGLSLSYDIIKAHGGEIKVETKEGEGSEFIIELPLTKTL